MMSKRIPGLLRWAFSFSCVAMSACSSHQDDVCQDIGDCSQGGSSYWITSCQTEAKALQDEATGAGCGRNFDAFFTCADSNYSCQGATAQFPGCADALSALDACLAATTANTSCVRLQAAEANCAAVGPDAGTATGTGTGTGTPTACTAARDCVAQCYLASVADVCAPRVDELQNVSVCAASCPP